ncbi:UNVERIFIED_CONTAM: hypothetical protein Slati_0092600 [Sesamum latifolium]|uniref:Reverse transcriptase n=1 Tax=Sesamum latifolium TaxID=2727402 RepID=A0AAW2Y8H2_9LAMI
MKETWNLLRCLSHQSTRTWLCVGDFNEIMHHHEKVGGNQRAQWKIEEFRECCLDCELHDLGCRGYPYTWCNKRAEPNTVRARLNRAVCSGSWADMFNTVLVRHEHSAGSDHGVLWWTYYQMERVMHRDADRGNAQEILMNKTRECRVNLLEGNRTDLETLGSRLRISKNKKKIKRLKDERGQLEVGEHQVMKVIIDYFSEVFRSSAPNANAMNKVIDMVESRVTMAMNESLLQLYTSEEVAYALKQMHRYKSLGPDRRLITNNVLLAYKPNHFLAQKQWGKAGHISLKLDVSKAYDRVEWSFHERVLGRIGFHPKVVSTIMLCVKSVTYSFLLNGSQFGF